MKEDYKKFSFLLNIGNINCQININNEKWLNFLKKKYVNFLVKSKKKEAEFSIVIGKYKYLRLIYESNSIQCPNDFKLFSPLNYYLRFLYSEELILNNGILLHSSALMKNNKAYIFSGSRKTGKSTILKLSKKYRLITDDCSIIKRDNKKYVLFSHPFYERTKIEKENVKLPIQAIFFIKPFRDHSLRKLFFEESFTHLAKNIIVKKKPLQNRKKILDKAMENCLAIAKEAPCYQLLFAKNASFWKLLP